MKSQLGIIILIFFSSFTSHSIDNEILSEAVRDHIIVQQLPIQIPQNLDWKVGDFQDRQIKKSGLNVGTLQSIVTKNEGAAFWLWNELKIVFQPKEIIETLIERKTGRILRYIVNGKEQSPPEMTDNCVKISQVTEQIKVPAGTYNSIRVVTRCPEDTTAQWTAPTKVNMSGFIKLAMLNENEDLNKPEYTAELIKFGKK